MDKIIIQEQITITEEEWNNIIKDYEKLPDTYGMGIGGKMLDKKGIVKEIKKLTDIGKQILVMKYEFKEWLRNPSQLRKARRYTIKSKHYNQGVSLDAEKSARDDASSSSRIGVQE